MCAGISGPRLWEKAEQRGPETIESHLTPSSPISRADVKDDNTSELHLPSSLELLSVLSSPSSGQIRGSGLGSVFGAFEGNVVEAEVALFASLLSGPDHETQLDSFTRNPGPLATDKQTDTLSCWTPGDNSPPAQLVCDFGSLISRKAINGSADNQYFDLDDFEPELMTLVDVPAHLFDVSGDVLTHGILESDVPAAYEPAKTRTLDETSAKHCKRSMETSRRPKTKVTSAPPRQSESPPPTVRSSDEADEDSEDRDGRLDGSLLIPAGFTKAELKLDKDSWREFLSNRPAMSPELKAQVKHARRRLLSRRYASKSRNAIESKRKIAEIDNDALRKENARLRRRIEELERAASCQRPSE